MWRDETLTANGRRLHLQQTVSDAPWLLMLHGVLRAGCDFAPLTGSLASRWRLALLDFRGHGRSEPADAYRVIDYAEDALAAIHHLEGPVVVYGHSLGAMVAAMVARRSNGVRAAILEDPPFDTMGGQIAKSGFLPYFQAIAEIASETDSDTCTRRLGDIPIPTTKEPNRRLRDVRDAASLRFSGHCLAKVDPSVLAPIVESRWLEGYDESQVFSLLDAPSLILQADTRSGGMLTDDQADSMLERIESALRIAFPGADHLLHWNRTDEVLRATHAFLETLRDTST